MHSFFVATLALIGGSVATMAVTRIRARRGQPSGAAGARSNGSRLDAQVAASKRPTPAGTAAMNREAQEVFEAREATHDLAIFDQLLRDFRDLSGADEAIFWRWVKARQTLIPAAWSTEGAPRPAFFDMRPWGSSVRWSAEEGELQQVGDVNGAPQMAAAPVTGTAGVYGVLTLSGTNGLSLDHSSTKSWLPRFAAQMAAVLQLSDLRRDYGRHMRQSGALLEAVQRLHGHRTAESLAQALCETAREVTSAPIAGLVRWNAMHHHGVVQATSPAVDIEPGFHVTADSLVGQVCDGGLPLVLEDARTATADADPYGGSPRAIGSLAIVPVRSSDQVIGALVVEGAQPREVAQLEARNAGLLAAVARGALEIVWEIEEVSRRARTDALTGLANRRHFDEQLRRVVAETDRFGGTCSLILVDLDHFKSVNDRWGHEAGDAVLKHVARVLTDTIRTVDTCARYGGEELAVLLPQTSDDGAAELAERIRQALSQRPGSHGGQLIPMTASFGVATYPRPVPSRDWLVLAADKALYEAKASGRNCVKVINASQVNPALYKSL